MLRLALLFLLVFGLVTPASAQIACSKREDVMKHLAAKFSEAPVAVGLANNGGVIEVLSTGNGSTWTIIITMPDGMSCLVAAGQEWETLPDAPEAVVPSGPKA